MRNWTVDIELDKSDGKEVFASCRGCANETKHKVVRSARYNGEATDVDFQWWEIFQIIECLGCENLSFRKSSANSEDYVQIGEDEWSYDEKNEVFPPHIRGRKLLDNTHFLPVDVKRVYDEVRLALSNPQPVLAGIGIRALVETVCKEKAALGANLETKIDDLVLKGFLTAESAEILHGLRFIGNDAAHQAVPHSQTTLTVAFDVIENLLTNVNILPNVAARELKRRNPAAT